MNNNLKSNRQYDLAECNGIQFTDASRCLRATLDAVEYIDGNIGMALTTELQLPEEEPTWRQRLAGAWAFLRHGRATILEVQLDLDVIFTMRDWLNIHFPAEDNKG